MKDNLNVNVKIIKKGRFTILNSCINVFNNNTLLLSAVYRCHDLPKAEFVFEFRKFLNKSK